MTLRVIFMGTPHFACPTLSEIIGQGHEVVACYTREPAPAGRGMALKPSPVQTMAERFGIPVFTPKTLKTQEAATLFASHGADVAVVVAYGKLLPKSILTIPELGCLNLHGSLLPRWRGAAPIQRAVMAGDAETGVMVMRMEEGLDTGPVAMAEKLAIGPDMTAADVHDRLMHLGADLMARALAALSRGALGFTPQAEQGITYASKIDKAEARIDWQKPATELHNLIRGLSPFPGAFFEADWGQGMTRVKVLRSVLAPRSGSLGSDVPGTVLDDTLTIGTGSGALRLIEVQRAGKGPVTAAEFLRGADLTPGKSLL
ncbi:MAG: methionyl-tRNA formyltransferase [Beijerinckiaceae bacterium]